MTGPKNKTVERIAGNLDISNIKRFSMPTTSINIKCPFCGDLTENSLEDFLEYPEKDNMIGAYCPNCEEEWDSKVKIISVIATLEISN